MIHKSINKKGPVVLVLGDISYVFPSGYAYLAGYLVEHGEKNVKILLRPNDETKYKNLIKEIMDLKPLLLGFGSIYPDLYPTKEITELLNKLGRNFPIVIGGQMVSPTPEFAVEITGADIGVIGEGEITLYNLVKALRDGSDISKVKGIVINNGEEKTLTGPGEYIEDLSKLPKIPYELFPSTDWLHVGRAYLPFPQPHNQYADRTVTIHGGRGCPFRCNFCYHHSRSRYRPIESMMQEAKELIKRFNANMLFFDDDLAIVSPQRARELAEGIKNLHKKVEWAVSIRMDVLSKMDDRLLRDMKESGCRSVGPGIESGSQKILDIIDKKISVDQIITGLHRLKDAGILPTGAFMVGQLSETPKDIEQSIDLMKKTLAYDKNINYAFNITTPFPGSILYDICFEKKLIKSHLDFFDRFGKHRGLSGITVNMTEMTDEELLWWFGKFRNAYKAEKRKVAGPYVHRIETWMIRADRLNKRLHKKYFGKLRNNIIGNIIKNSYEFLYDLMQRIFSKLQLYLLGVKKYKV